MGPDMVCAFGFVSRKLGLNVNFTFDLSHSTQNVGKATIKAVGLYRHEIIYCCAQNVLYGSVLSPARVQQIQEICEEWFETGDPNTDPCFLLHLERIVKQMKLQVDLASDGCAQVALLYDYTATHT